ncbi:MAG: thioredoxin domain-containing protein [Terracidiphilus sp.]|jgi:protein-disulfide isomerase|nr:thioredoxin domain-containing protein [Terracidiphilus sp.]
MFRFPNLAQSVPSRVSLLLAAALAFSVSAARSQAPIQAPIQVLDASALHPPLGARVAIVEFDDLQCPACAAANPTLKAAAAQYKIPWLRLDFLIPYHNWSRNAAINARWFDLQSKALGDEYRDQLFANQSSIYNPGSLAQFTQTFARGHGVTLPFSVDPQGKLASEVDADGALARRTGITSTPTIFVVAANSKGKAFAQVLNPAQDLYTTIDRALADTAPPLKPAPAKTPAPKKSSGK